MRILILGGTTEASALAAALAGRRDIAPVLSLAGRTARPALPPIPYRIGGFGGAAGLAAYLAHEGVTAVVDATHPFATRISASAVAACDASGVPLVRFSRPAWEARPDDRWTVVADLAAAAAALGAAPRRVLLTVGRLGLAAFRAAPQHRYLVRTIDAPDGAELPPDHRLILGRGPFSAAAELALLRHERIDVLVSKNSGGTGAAAKLEAARTLATPVVLVARPAGPDAVEERTSVDAVLDWLAAHAPAPPVP